MNSTELDVFYGVRESLERGYAVCLISVAQTWGASPRPVGSLLAINSARHIYGSVSGGCIEEDLVERLLKDFPSKPELQLYGETAEERHRFGLPCGGAMKLVIEPIINQAELDDLIRALESRQILSRTLDLHTGEVRLAAATPVDCPQISDDKWVNIFGPSYQLIVIGAGQTSEYLASMALSVGFKVHVCDPRPEYHEHWSIEGTEIHRQYPDDAIRAIGIDQRTAVVTLTHDPKLDDQALLEALGSSAFYVGALGSVRTNNNRRQRLKEHFGFDDHTLGKLHGPVGLSIGSKTPPEIALSVLAHLVAEKHAKSEKLMIAGIILAAGKGSRFGGDKLLARLSSGRRVIEETVTKYQLETAHLVCVVAENDYELQSLLDELNCPWTIAEKSEEGMSQSLQAGLDYFADADAWMVILGDMPYIQPNTIASIRERCNASYPIIVVPQLESGQRGHPVVFSHHYREALMQISGDTGGKKVIENGADSVCVLTVEDMGIVKDIDVPMDLE